MHNPVSLSEHIRLIYAAADNPDIWGEFIDRLCEELKGNSGMVVALGSDRRPLLFSQQGVDSQAQAAYEQHFMYKDILLERFRNAGSPSAGWIGIRQQIISDGEIEQTEYYADYMRPLRQYHQIGANIGQVGACSFGGVTILRSKEAGQFGEDDVDLLRIIAPHLRQSFLMGQKLHVLKSAQSTLDQVAGISGLSAITLDERGAILNLTPKATAMLQAGDGLRCRAERLTAALPVENERLQNLLASARRISQSRGASQVESSPGGSMLITRLRSDKPLHITVTPCPANSQLLGGSATVCVFITDLAELPVPRGEVLRQLFGLSYAEVRLADLLICGHDLKHAGTLLRVTENSVRFMAKTIFRKAGVRSQSGLMQLMLRLPGIE